MTVKQLALAHNMKEICLPRPEREVKGGYTGDLLSWVMGRAGQDNAWVTIMSNINTVAVATLSDVAVIILAEGVALSDDIVATAREKEINILSTDKSAFEIIAEISADI